MNLFEQLQAWIPPLLQASGVTVLLTILAVSSGLVLSIFLAVAKISKIYPLRWFATAYIFVFRGTPLLMQLYFVYYALPQISPSFTIQDGFVAAYIAFSLNSAAYLAEIIRAAIQSIDKGQLEAAKSLGMSYPMAMRLIIFPQSIRRLIPPVGNEFIMVIKDTALVSSIAIVDLMKKTMQINSSAATPAVFIPSAILYLIITAVFTYVFHKLEKRFSIYE